MHVALSALLLGVINIAIVVAILVLIGYIIVWVMGLLGFPIPAMVQKIFMAIVALIALYMFVALLLGYGIPGPILLR
jgi:D-ribose pyranose/furanose isomerase RbsD